MNEAVLQCWLRAQLSLDSMTYASIAELFELAGWWATTLNEHQIAVQD